MEIPQFLIEMSKQLNEQDNRCTSDPIFMVAYDKWLTCADGRGDKEIFLVNDNGDYTECANSDDVISHLIEHYEEWAMEFLSENSNGVFTIGDLGEYFDLESDAGDLPENVEIEQISMQKEMTIVKACLTEADANAFIARKQHDYAKLYTYAYSMYFCPQMMQLRNWIMSLSESGK